MRLVLKRIVQVCLLAVLVWSFPYNNIVRASDFTFVVDYELQKPIVRNIACPCSKDFKVIKKKVVLRKVNYCSCVLYGKAQTGYNKSVGFARNWPKNTNEPTVGGVVITNESYAGHVAVITKVTETTVSVKEANYRRCAYSERTISRNSPIIIGYWQG